MTQRRNRQNVQDQLRTLIRRGERVAEGLDADAFNRPPEDGRWSVGQCLDHLNEIARLYLPALAECIEEGRARGLTARPGSSERTLIGRLLVWSQEPPVRIRTRTYDAIVPDQRLDPEEVLESFRALHEELIVRINEAADLDRKKIRMRSLLDSRLKLSLGDWFRFLAAHGRRHVWQAERARESLPPGPDPREATVDADADR